MKISNNQLVIVVWYYGIDSATYVKGKAGLIYEVVSNEQVVCYSDKSTLSKKTQDFVCHKNKLITFPLGLSYTYDSRFYDDYDSLDYKIYDFHSSIETSNSLKLYKNSIKKLEIKPIVLAKLVDSNKRIYDLCCERVGFLNCKIKADTGKTIRIAFGEHLIDGQVRHSIGIRNFTVEFIGNGDWFNFSNLFRRLGCRYFQILDNCEVLWIGIKETEYPLELVERRFDDDNMQKIYDVSVRTLRLCMHEHYEDCPWREQALYTMDSRNQMLFGYFAFNEFDYPRANLELMSKAQKKDRLLPLCFPAGIDMPIPFFNLMYIVEMYEYALYSKDISLLKENFTLLKDIIDAFFIASRK